MLTPCLFSTQTSLHSWKLSLIDRILTRGFHLTTEEPHNKYSLLKAIWNSKRNFPVPRLNECVGCWFPYCRMGNMKTFQISKMQTSANCQTLNLHKICLVDKMSFYNLFTITLRWKLCVSRKCKRKVELFPPPYPIWVTMKSKSKKKNGLQHKSSTGRKKVSSWETEQWVRNCL